METKNKNLETQLLQFQKKINAVKKDAINPHFKKSYATLTQILSEVKPVLSEFDILLTQPIIENKVGTELTYSGQKLTSFIELPTNLNPQQLGSAITYFRRYTLAALLSLEIEDDDANESSKPTTQQPANDLPWLNKGSDTWNKVVDAIASMQFSIADVEKKYKLSKAIKDELINIQAKGK
jgi:hypothetical protein